MRLRISILQILSDKFYNLTPRDDRFCRARRRYKRARSDIGGETRRLLPQNMARKQHPLDFADRLDDGPGCGVEHELGGGRRLVIGAGAGKSGQVASARFGVVAFRVAAFADLDRGRNVDFTEQIAGDASGLRAISSRGRYRGHDGEVTVAGKVCCDFGEATDVFAPVVRGKSEVTVESCAQRVAIEQHRRTAAAEQPALECTRERESARTGQTREPQYRAGMVMTRDALVRPQGGFDGDYIDRHRALAGVDAEHEPTSGAAAIDFDHQPPVARVVRIRVGGSGSRE